MTGREHYVEAETLLHEATEIDVDQQDAMYLVATAQVHATLALAAATSPTMVPAP